MLSIQKDTQIFSLGFWTFYTNISICFYIIYIIYHMCHIFCYMYTVFISAKMVFCCIYMHKYITYYMFILCICIRLHKFNYIFQHVY